MRILHYTTLSHPEQEKVMASITTTFIVETWP